MAKPVLKATRHDVSLALWSNKTKAGVEFFSISLQRSAYIEGQWRHFNSFPVSRWSEIQEMIEEVKAYLAAKGHEAILLELETGERPDSPPEETKKPARRRKPQPATTTGKEVS